LFKDAVFALPGKQLKLAAIRQRRMVKRIELKISQAALRIRGGK